MTSREAFLMRQRKRDLRSGRNHSGRVVERPRAVVTQKHRRHQQADLGHQSEAQQDPVERTTTVGTDALNAVAVMKRVQRCGEVNVVVSGDDSVHAHSLEIIQVLSRR